MKKLIAHLRYWLKIKPKWNQCRYASCWDGENAVRRMMNILSPYFSDGKFQEYVDWMLSRGCNTAHLFLINGGDGEGAGYNCATDNWHATIARRRIRKLRLAGLAVVPWLIADDSAAAARDLFKNPEARVKSLAAAELFDHASYVVIGLEMDEPRSFPDGPIYWPKVAAALRGVYSGKLGTHHCSGNSFRYADLGDIVLGQLPESCTPSQIRNQIATIQAKGKQAVGFEYQRNPNRDKAMAALDAGAVGVGNW